MVRESPLSILPIQCGNFQVETMIHQRKHPRAPVVIEVNYKILDVLHGNTILNISQGGMFIRTDEPLDLGTEVSVEFSLPIRSNDSVLPGQKQVLLATGVVVWNHHPTKSRISPYPRGMGIQLQEILRRDLDLVKEYVDHILGKEGL